MAGFRREATTDWLAPLEDGLSCIGRTALATVVLAVIRGLIMDLEANGDTERIDQAFTDFLGAIDHFLPFCDDDINTNGHLDVSLC